MNKGMWTMRQDNSNKACLEYQRLMRSIPASIRFAVNRDLQQIENIERASFEYPWLDCDFHSHLCQMNTLGYIVEYNGCVAAYAIIKYFSDHIELCNLAVDAYCRRQKIASLIVSMLKAKLYLENKNYIEVYVSEYNMEAQLFLRDSGFLAKELIRDCYAKGHDCYYMTFNPNINCPTNVNYSEPNYAS